MLIEACVACPPMRPALHRFGAHRVLREPRKCSQYSSPYWGVAVGRALSVLGRLRSWMSGGYAWVGALNINLHMARTMQIHNLE